MQYHVYFLGSSSRRESFIRENDFSRQEVGLISMLNDVYGKKDCIFFYNDMEIFHNIAEDVAFSFEYYCKTHNIKLIRVF